MSLKLYNESDIQNIANAIRLKAKTEATFKVSDMALQISSLSGGITDEQMALLVAEINKLEGAYESTPISCFTFSGNTITGYSGDYTVVNIPSSYSIDDNGNVIEGKDYLVTAIGPDVFVDQGNIIYINIPEGITSIGNRAFQGCIGLEQITIPETVTTMGSYLFSQCTMLKKVKLLNNINSIPAYTFESCASLSTFELPESVTIIEDRAFTLSKIESIDLKNVVTINQYAFYGCNSLTEVKTTKLQTIASYGFANCSKLDMKFPESLKSVGTYCFSGCSNLKEAIFSDNATYYGSYCFLDCSNLERVKLGKNISGFPKGAFENCTHLKYIDAYSTSAGYISEDALNECRSLVYIKLFSTGRWTSNIFSEVNSTLSWNHYTGEYGKIYVPANIIEDYKTTQYTNQWSSRYVALNATGTLRINTINSNVTVINALTGNEMKDGDIINQWDEFIITATFDYFINHNLGVDNYTIHSGDKIVYDGTNPVFSVKAFSGNFDFDYNFGNNTPVQIKNVGDYISEHNLTAEETFLKFGWALGDTVNVYIQSRGNMPLKIIGVCHDKIPNKETKAGLTLEMNKIISGFGTDSYSYYTTTSGSTAVDYVETETFVFMSKLESNMPIEWQNVIKPVVKEYRANYRTDTSLLKEGTMRIWSLSTKEYFGEEDETTCNEGVQYEYYRDVGTAVKTKIADSTSSYLTRTLHPWSSSQNYGIFLVDHTGKIQKNSGTLSGNIAPAFCVGGK